MHGCPLCDQPGGQPLWQDSACRIVLVDEPRYPGFCRLIWNQHVAEMTDLAPEDRSHVFSVLMALESAMRAVMQPDKINLASFGNMVPHVHWHVIPRYRDDAHFPDTYWSPLHRPDAAPHAVDVLALTQRLQHLLGPSIPTEVAQA